jgi:hypothetical protein
MKKKKHANYKGFVLEFEERVKRGFPIDMTTMREMAKKYGTPIPRRNDE